MGFDIEHVRNRPGMYVGSTAAGGVNRVVLETIANVVDLFLSGRARSVSMQIDDDGYGFVVADDGPGFGVGYDDRATEVEGFFTSIHDTPTADGHAPHFHLDSIGALGLGVVSALSQSVEVRSAEANGLFSARFAAGQVVEPFARDPSVVVAHGATIAVRIDRGIFSEGINHEALRQRLIELGPLLPGLKVTLDGTDLSGNRTISHLAAEFVNAERALRTDLAPVRAEQFHQFEYRSRGCVVRGAIGWFHDRIYSPMMRTFCNFIELTEEGDDTRAITEGLRLALGQAPVDQVLLGFVGVFSIEVQTATIGGPTRGRLDDPNVLWLLADAFASAIDEMAERDPTFRTGLQARMPCRAAPLSPPIESVVPN
jgi:DNA gyrase subunit B